MQNHLILLYIFECPGCTPSTIDRFKTYFFGRQQTAKIGHIEFAWEGNGTGTLQSSVFEPNMLTVSVNFIQLKISTGYLCKTVIYADDTITLLCIQSTSPPRIYKLILSMSKRLQKLSEYLCLSVMPVKWDPFVSKSRSYITRYTWRKTQFLQFQTIRCLE